ncbi:hypothetical protein [Moritella sp. JT01]|uniref:hypothetical protein n=1 Tax=Moritella sp. JT01 TaxID=756698 RepID=UPI0012F950E0|nr:hypothetical protein [Moritella sp. JT01]
MNEFSISRINTDFGIFRISGLWSKESLESLRIDIHSIEVMGTDGWVLLNQSNEKVINLITDLMPTLKTHLLANSR